MPRPHTSSSQSRFYSGETLGCGGARPQRSVTERCPPAQVYGARHAGRALLAIVAGAWIAGISVRTASAEEMSRSAPSLREGAAFDLRLSAGGAAAEYRQHSTTMAELDAVSLNAMFRWGGFLSSHFMFGYELLVGRHTDVGTPAIRPSYAGEFNPRPHEGYTVVAPLGAFFELYPVPGGGFYLGASAGAGLLSLPDLADEDGALMAGYGAEIGYDTSGSGKHGLGLFLRYSHWSASAIISDHGDELSADEVSLGARWAFSMSP